MRSRNIFLFFVMFGVTLLSEAALSQGFGLTSSGRTLARNGLYLAGTDGLTAANMNPASLAYLNGRALEFSVVDRRAQYEYERATQERFRSRFENNYSFSGGVYWAFSSRLTAALAYDRPMDYQVNWPFALVFTKGISPTLAAFDMFHRIQIDALTPSLALRFGKVALGITANAYRLRQHTAFPLANKEWYQDRGEAAYQFEYQQEAWAYGLNLGMRATFSNKLRAGGFVRSAFDAALEGQANSQMLADLEGAATRVDLSAKLEMPWAFGAGLVYQLSESWEMNLDAAYTLWANTQNSFDFKFNDDKWQTHLAELDTVTGIRGSSVPSALENGIDAGLGFEYAPLRGFTYRAGYRYSKSPNSPETFNMFFPSVDQHWLSFGIGYKGEVWSIDAAMAYALGVSAKITSGENFNSPGKYDSNALVPGVKLQYKF